MPIRVLVKDHPHRTIALSTEGHALVFRHTHAADLVSGGSTLSLGHVSAGRQNTPPKCMVEFGGRPTFDLGAYRTVVIAQGTLGLITLNSDVFICVVTGDVQAASPHPGETVRKIVSVEFCREPWSLALEVADHVCRLSESFGLRPCPQPGRQCVYCAGALIRRCRVH
jgi:synaptojanin